MKNSLVWKLDVEYDEDSILNSKELIHKGGSTSVWRCTVQNLTLAIKIFNFKELLSQTYGGDIIDSRISTKSIETAIKGLNLDFSSPKNSTSFKNVDRVSSSSITNTTTDFEQQKVEREINIQQQLGQHPNIVAYYGHEIVYKQDDIFQQVSLFQEYLPCNLYDIIQKRKSSQCHFTMKELVHLSTEILNGLIYMHDTHSIPHYDLKSKNILVKEQHDQEIQTVKICDFGACAASEIGKNQKNYGTLRWTAPEVLASIQQGVALTKDSFLKADIWSFGMILYEMMTLKLPFHEIILFDVKDHILKNNLPIFDQQTKEQYPKLIEILSNYCLQHDPSKRASANELKVILHQINDDR